MAIDPDDLRLSERHLRLLERLAEQTGKTPTEILDDVLDTAAQTVDQLKAALQAGIDSLDAGLGKPLDIDAIKKELEEELDSSGQPRK